MGVDIGDLVSKKSIPLSSLSEKTIAIDAFNVIYQFLSSIRQDDGTPLMDFKGNITSHLSGLFYRTAKLMENGIKPVYVFDGKTPLFKEDEKERRARGKKEAEEKWKKALEEERFEDAKKYAQATSRLTEEMVEESKNLLGYLGIPWIQAKSEGEAQSALMAKKGLVYAASSQDYDSLLFGAPILLRNISITGRRKIPRQDKYVLIEPEELSLDSTLKELGLNREQLIIIGLLCGTDYNQGVYRVGPKTALKIVKEHKDFEGVKKYVGEKYNHTFENYIGEVIEFFMEPPYLEVKKIEFRDIEEESVKKLLCDEHDFSEERVERTVDNLKKIRKEKWGQSRLGKWF
ncbi:flap endonuclease-1 [Candidatus Micrarchaeota archaeon]|nr:flap endonuclease-1 [Candidatus Micrarchaeota archaeon]